MPQANANWAGNLSYRAAHTLTPRSVSEIQDIVSRSSKLKALGSRHSFNEIADTEGDHLSLAKLDKVVELNPEANTVTIEGGVRYGELAAYLHRKGFALPNLASLPHISVAGAVATATHGSGIDNGSLATSVSGIQAVAANGSVVTFSRQENPDAFPGVVVSLGAIGIVTKLTLDLEPSYPVRQDLFQNLPLSALARDFEPIAASAYSVSLFTDWKSESFHQVWLKSRLDQNPKRQLPDDFYGATPATENLHPIAGHDAVHCTQQLGTPGPWHERLPHFRLEFTPSSGAELQSEYFVARDHAYPALQALFALRASIAPLAHISEIRCIAADDHWLSPCYERASVAIHFTWKPDWPAVRQLLPQIEAALAPFEPHPHWGKLFTMDPADLTKRYPRFDDFCALVRQLDPRGKFRNAFLQRFLK